MYVLKQCQAAHYSQTPLFSLKDCPPLFFLQTRHHSTMNDNDHDYEEDVKIERENESKSW